MADSESVSSASRKALIGTLIAIALNHVSIFLGYYLSKVLAAPNLKIEYVNATATLNPLIIEQNAFSGITKYPLLKNYIFKQLSKECEDWIRNGKIRRECIAESTAVLTQFRDMIAFESSTIRSNMETIDKWDNKSELVLRPMDMPGMGAESIQSIVHQN